MNDADIATAFRSLGLAYALTTLVSPKKILLRVRNCVDNNIPRIEKPKPNMAGRTTFDSSREILPLFAQKNSSLVPSNRNSLGKLTIEDAAPTMQFVHDTPPNPSEYREVIIQRAKRQRLIVKRSELQDKKIELSENSARISVIPEPLILSKVFNTESDESDDSEPAAPKKKRKAASIFATHKDIEYWAHCKRIYPLGDNNLYQIQSNKSKKRLYMTVAPTAFNTNILLSSKYRKRWIAYFQTTLAIWVATTWKINYYDASEKALHRRLKYEQWLNVDVAPKIRAKLCKTNEGKSTSVVDWALNYDHIEFRDSEKTKWFVRMEQPNNDMYKNTTLKLPKAACLELDILFLVLHPQEYFYRRVYHYFYHICVVNAISDLNSYLRVTNMMGSTRIEEDMIKELRIWWSMLAACGADYITDELLEENKNLSLEKPTPALPLASFH